MLLSIAVLGIPDNVPVTGILNQWYLGTSSSGLLPSITRNLAFFFEAPLIWIWLRNSAASMCLAEIYKAQ